MNAMKIRHDALVFTVGTVIGVGATLAYVKIRAKFKKQEIKKHTTPMQLPTTIADNVKETKCTETSSERLCTSPQKVKNASRIRSRVTPEQIKLMIEYADKGLSNVEIAGLLGKPQSTVDRHLSKLRKEGKCNKVSKRKI